MEIQIYFGQLVLFQLGPMIGGSDGTSVRGPESQGGACESLQIPIYLSHRRLILIFSQFWRVFSTFQFIQQNNYVKFTQISEFCLGEKSQPVPGAPKQLCPALQNFSWRPWFQQQSTSSVIIILVSYSGFTSCQLL